MSGTIELVCRSNSRVVFRKIEIKELPMPSRRKGVKVVRCIAISYQRAGGRR